MNISINIPSWHRPNGVKTLDYIPFATVWVDESEYDDYKKANPEANIISCPKGIQGNLCRVRNYIIKNQLVTGGGDAALIVDDDLYRIERFSMKNNFGYVREILPTNEIIAFLEKYTLMAQDMGVKFWGINVNCDNMTYRHFTPFSTTSYIGGPFQCFLRGNRCYYDENLPLKEDYDMTLQQLESERAVLRVNYYHYICKQSKQAGGCATYRNRVREQEQFDLLQQKWGSKIVKCDTTNKGRSNKTKLTDYNPIIKPPIKGV